MNRLTPGCYFKSRGQRYVIRGKKDYWTRDGRYLEMIRYASQCAEPGCDTVFEAIATKSVIRRGELNRRCDLHKAPGLPVPIVKVKRKRPKKPATKQLAARWARLGRKAALAVRRGQQPSYLD